MENNANISRTRAMKPILFNTDMVQAILDGRKTTTRRIAKNNPEECTSKVVNGICKICDDKGGFYLPDDYVKARSPYQIGDILYVRETWKRFCRMLYGWEDGAYIPLDYCEGYQYKADEQCICTKGINLFCDNFNDQKDDIRFDDRWYPSIHMPKEAARLFLRVTKVKLARLHDADTYAAYREGIPECDICSECIGTCDDCWQDDSPLHKFERLWNKTIKKANLSRYGWAANPWVWVIEFEQISKDEVLKDD